MRSRTLVHKNIVSVSYENWTRILGHKVCAMVGALQCTGSANRKRVFLQQMDIRHFAMIRSFKPNRILDITRDSTNSLEQLI